MPPKNKGKDKKPAKARTPTLIDGLTKEEMSKEQLEEHIVRLREELDREREERNYFQLERDKIHTFWEVTNRKLEEAKAELKNLDKDIEEDEVHHQVEIKVYKQKMKHLMCEHQNTIAELKADGVVSIEVLQKEQEQLESELHEEMAVMVNMQEPAYENLIKELELRHDEEMTKTRNSLEEQLAEVKARHEKNLELQKVELDNWNKNQFTKTEEHWKSHINTLEENHRKGISEVTAFCQTQLKNITSKDPTKTKKENKLDSILLENKRLAERLAKAQEEVAVNQKLIARLTCLSKNPYGKNKRKQLCDLKREHETLEEKFSQLQLERDELCKSFTQNIEKVRQKADVKHKLLENRLESLMDRVEKMQVQLSSVLSASNMDQTALIGVTNKIEENIDSFNNSIKTLKYKKAQISKARKDLLLAYEAKQRALGVDVEELCVKPFESSLAGKSLEQNKKQ